MNIESQNTLVNLQNKLTRLHDLKQDVIVSADKLTFWRGELKLTEPVLTDSGVMTPDTKYVCTDRFIDSIASRLKIPAKYLRDVHKNRTPVFDDILNGHLHADTYFQNTENGSVPLREFPQYSKNSLVRLYAPTSEGERGTARYFGSDRYGIFDNHDALVAFLGGIQKAGFNADDIEVRRANITDTKMLVEIDLPGIQTEANELLEGYVPPMNARNHTDDAIVNVGLLLSNSEVGSGALNVNYIIRINRCSNGWVIEDVNDARRVHLGGQHNEGVVKMGRDTADKNAELVMLQVKDAVQTYCDTDFLIQQVERVTAKAKKRVEDPIETFKTVSKKLSLSENEHAGIFNHFMSSGVQNTAGGITQAITSYIQTDEALTNVDRAHDLQMQAVRAMELV